jgi:hypothetical protein
VRTRAPALAVRLAASLALVAVVAGSSAALLATASVNIEAGRLLEVERQGIADALFVANLTPRDLRFARAAEGVRHRLPIVGEAVSSPLEAADRLLGIHSGAADGMLSRMTGIARRDLLGDERPSPRLEVIGPALPPDVPAVLARPVAALAGAIATANEEIRSALAGLSPEERRLLIEGLPQWAVESPEVRFDFVRQGPVSQSQLLSLLERVDHLRILRAGEALAAAVEEEVPALRAAAGFDWRGRARFTVAGVVVELAGRGDDVHASGDAMLCIDLGGNDTYTGRYGAGVGYASVLIDVAGNDTYRVGDLAVGAGLLGIGLAYDLAGSNSFNGGSLTFGSGLAGLGALLASDGGDTYRSTTLTQGFGLFGIGLLLDPGGNDAFIAHAYAQGAARTSGVGWLIDRSGNDLYRAGARLAVHGLPGVHLSAAQGFSAGYGVEAAGGVGLLTDHDGDDAYVGEVRCQAAGFHSGLGSLADMAGTDTYSSYGEAQAAASDEGSAYLFDLAGDDAYVARGPGAQAFAALRSVSLLLDRAGDDLYAGAEGGPSIAIGDAVSVFVDSAGDDRYLAGPESEAALGAMRGLAVFVDLGGTDAYGAGFRNAAAARSPGLVAFDAEALPVGREVPPDPLEGVVAGSRPLVDDAELRRILARASSSVGVGGGEALRHLAEMGAPAIGGLLRLSAGDAAEVGVLAMLVQFLGAAGERVVLDAVSATEGPGERVGLLLAARLRLQAAAPAALAALDRAGLEAAAARVAGVLRLEAGVDALLALAGREDFAVAREAARALALIGSDRAVPTAQALLTSPESPIREAALDLLAQHPERALAIAQTMTVSREERPIRLALELAGRLQLSEAVEFAAIHLDDPRPGVRLQALLALEGRVPLARRPRVFELQRDPHPLVRAVATSIDQGR